MSGISEYTQTVLVIEDEATQQKLLQSHLESLGVRGVIASTVKDGLNEWKNNPEIRIVITDLQLPDGDGYEIIRAVVGDKARDSYIMVLTQHHDKQSLKKALAMGVDDFIAKPIDKVELKLRISAAKRNLRLADQNRVISAMATLVANRGRVPDYHLLRIREYCQIIGDDLRKNCPELGLTKEAVEDIANICVLHDIGNISIPDNLLNKKGRCTEQEYEKIKEHTSIGAEILQDLYRQTGSMFLMLGRDMAKAHHERWDGSGYPEGLNGDEIPVAARIMTFADTYDAILSPRRYKDPLPPSHAEKIIHDQKGKQFDPRVVEAFERNKEKLAEVHQRMDEC